MHNGQVPMIQSNVSKRGNFCDCFGYFTICCQSPELATPLTEIKASSLLLFHEAMGSNPQF